MACFVNKGEKVPVSFNGSVLRDEGGRMPGLSGLRGQQGDKSHPKLEEANVTYRGRSCEMRSLRGNNELKSTEAQLIQSERWRHCQLQQVLPMR